MITPENKLVQRFDAFSDTEEIAEWLYDMTHGDDCELTPEQRYQIMEARDNLLGLYDMCRIFVVASMRKDHDAKYLNVDDAS